MSIESEFKELLNEVGQECLNKHSRQDKQTVLFIYEMDTTTDR